jgi:DNA-binding CsgD family transcriptional regulator
MTRHRRAIDALSPAETRVLRLLATGLTNKEIARELGIAPATARTHIANVFGILQVGNRVEATLRYQEMGRGGDP